MVFAIIGLKLIVDVQIAKDLVALIFIDVIVARVHVSFCLSAILI
ncbi:hypothetical protein METMT2_0753 [Methanothermobacter sp. MT-2]|nr:hypothetical protein METMT2_0753 [Methanothermobacter sp. MT-2]